MASNEPDWRELAKDLYREAQEELLDRWRGMVRDDVEFFKEELREALLDLKQAVIEDREADVLAYVEEILGLLAELRRRSQDGSNG